MTELHLIRHGATASNRARRYMGRSHEPLDSEGRWQVRQLGRRLGGLCIDAFYASPLRRATETAAILAEPQRLDVTVDRDIIEMELSRWAGMSGEEIASAEPETWAEWVLDPTRLCLEGIEPFPAIRERVESAIRRITEDNPGRTVAVVTHDVIVRMAVLVGLGLPLEVYRKIPADNASLTTIEVGGPRACLRRFNDTGHLDGAERPRGPADG